MCPQLVQRFFRFLGTIQPEFLEEIVKFHHFLTFSVLCQKFINKFSPAYLDLFECCNLFLLDMVGLKIAIFRC